MEFVSGEVGVGNMEEGDDLCGKTMQFTQYYLYNNCKILETLNDKELIKIKQYPLIDNGECQVSMQV